MVTAAVFLARPGLERLRDLVAEGCIETLFVYAPDRLSRKYAYQVCCSKNSAVVEQRRFF